MLPKAHEHVQGNLEKNKTLRLLQMLAQCAFKVTIKLQL